MSIFEKLTLYLGTVGTTRKYKGRYYKVIDVLTIMICGLLCGLKDMTDIHAYAKGELGRKVFKEYFNIQRIPSYVQMTRIISIIDPKHLNDAFIGWVKWFTYFKEDGTTITLDGKTIRSTEKMLSYESPLHIVSAHISALGLTIGQLAVKSKSNEIPAVQELIRMLDIKGCIVVADALNTQKETAKEIIDNGGNYILPVKKNHPILFEEITEMFDYITTNKVELNNKEYEYEYLQTIEKNRDRIETKKAYILEDISWLEEKDKWKNLYSVGMIINKIDKNGYVTEETRCYLISKKMSVKEFLKHTRNEWSVETMHWHLDVNFDEDSTRVISENSQQNLNMLRKIVLNVLQIYKTCNNLKTSIAGLMRDCLFETIKLFEVLNSIDISVLQN